MNDLSLFIYLTDVAANVGKLFHVLGVISVVAACVSLLVCGIAMTDGDPDIVDKGTSAAKVVTKFALVPGVTSLLLAVLIPSKDTMYLIAASELGEYMLQTDAAQAGSQMVTDLFAAISAHLKASLPEVAEAAKEAVK